MKSKKRIWIRACSYIFTLVLVLGIFSYQNYINAKNYQRQIEYSYQRSLSELNDYVDNIQINLEKSLYANTAPLVNEIASSIWRESSNAKNCIAQLPISELQLETTYKFLSQVGEYSLSLSKKMENSPQISDEDHKQLLYLSQTANSLAENLSSATQSLADGTLSFERVNNAVNTLSSKTATDVEYFSNSFTTIEDAMVDYPVLIYDGPFSDHLIDKKSEFLKSAKEITKDEARKLVAKRLNIDESKISDDEDEGGNMPSHCFFIGDCNISVTKNGGYFSYYINPRYVGEIQLSQENAVELAQKYLKEIGVENMVSTYYTTNDGVCVINFAYSKNDVVYYTDLIKVSVALDNGEIVGLDSRGFLVNHKERELPSPVFTRENAQRVLSPYLSVLNYRKALIPLSSGQEAFCYEFHCKGSNGDEVLVYIDTQTCIEKQILFLLYSDGGVLTR